MNLKNKIQLLFVQTYQNRKIVPYIGMQRDKSQKRKESPYMEIPRDNDQKKRKGATISVFRFVH